MNKNYIRAGFFLIVGIVIGIFIGRFSRERIAFSSTFVKRIYDSQDSSGLSFLGNKGSLDKRSFKAIKEVEQGDECYKQKALRRSIFHYRKAIHLQPVYPEAYYKLGIVLNELTHYQEAMQAYKDATRLNPDYAEAHFNRGRVLEYMRHYQEAEESFKEVLRIDPKFALAYKELADVYLKMNRFEMAKEALQKAALLQIELDGNSEEAKKILATIANIKEDEDNDQGLKKTGMRALNIETAKTYYQLGAVFGELERCEDAIKAYEKAVDLNPESPETYYNMGLCYSLLQRYQDAVFSFKRVIKLDAGFYLAYVGLGKVYLEMKKSELAREMFQKAAIIKIKLEGDTQGTKKMLTDASNPKRIDKTASVKIMDAETHYKLATVLGEMEKYKEAINSYNKAVDITGNDTPPRYFYNRALAYKRLGKLGNAAIDLKKAVVGSESPKVYRELAEVLLALDKYKEASKIFYRAGTMFFRDKMNDEALYCFMNVKKLSPNTDLSLVEALLQKKK